MKEGQRVKLSGGYDMDPKYLSGKDYLTGYFIKFIPGQNGKKAAVIKLDEPILIENYIGEICVLELRYVGSQWGKENICHIELCNFIPDDIKWNDRKQGKWIESNCSVEFIK